MSVDQKLVLLFSGVVGVLLVASAIGWWFQTRNTSEAKRETIENLVARIKAWWAMVAIFAVGFMLGPTATLILFALTSFYTLREFISLTPTRPADNPPLAAAFYVFLPLQYALIWMNWYGLFAILIPVYGFILTSCVAVLQGDVEDFLLRAARIQWGLMLTVYSISHAPALLILPIPGFEGQNFLLLFFLIAVVQFSDVMQYVFGKMLGKNKVAPHVSPSKTWEGLIGGGSSAALLGAALYWITPFSPLQAGAMALVIVTMGFLGGLALSAVKRSMGVKDWGAMVKGHGGVLDRMDSVCFSAPVFFHLTRYFFTP